MMATRRDNYHLYENNHNLLIINKSGFDENRTVSISVAEFSDYLQLKIRDPNDFIFNYTINIDSRTFEIIRTDQSLDIDFIEFKSNLIEMLQQTQRKEMFIKGEIDNDICRLIFYGKSKIKSIIYLTIDLRLTNQKEIFEEMNNNLIEMQRVNRNLVTQLQNTKKLLQDKDFEIRQYTVANTQLKKEFRDNLQNINYLFSKKLQDCQNELLNKILGLTQKLFRLIQNVQIVKTETVLKSDSSARLLQSMENLRIESIESTNLIQELKRENANLKTMQYNHEKFVEELNRKIAEKEKYLANLKSERDEIERDAKQAAIIIAQKANANEELAKDLVQANQMLVNFNHLYESKNKEIEDLQAKCGMKERIIQDQQNKIEEILRQFEEYKATYSLEEQNRLTQELRSMRKRAEELEKTNREAAKLNELLTRKLATGDYMHRHYHQ